MTRQFKIVSSWYVQRGFALDVCRLDIIQEDVIRAHVKSVRRDILHVCMMTSSKKYQRIKVLNILKKMKVQMKKLMMEK